MTVLTDTARVAHPCDGVQTEFAIPFQFERDSDLRAIVTDPATGDETPLEIGYDYTLAGAGTNPPTGVLTALAAPPDGHVLQIFNDPPAVQTVRVPPGRVDSTAQIERPLDRLTQIAQRIKDAGARALRLSEAEEPASLVLPSRAARPSKLIGCDANGGIVPVAGTASPGFPPTTPFVDTLLDDPGPTEARATLGAVSSVDVAAALSAGVQILPMQCRLEYQSSSSLRLNRCNGNQVVTLDEHGIPTRRTLPDPGPTLSWVDPVTGTRLPAFTLLHVYLYWNGSALALEASQTPDAEDEITGLRVKTGDVRKLFVGLAILYLSGPVFHPDTDRRASVASYYNRRRKSARTRMLADGSISDGSFSAVPGTVVQVPQLAGTSVRATATGGHWGSSAGAAIQTLIAAGAFSEFGTGGFGTPGVTISKATHQDGSTIVTVDPENPTSVRPLFVQAAVESAANRATQVVLAGAISGPGVATWAGHASDPESQTVLTVDYEG